MKPVVRNIFSNDLYSYNGENNFVNLRTLKSGSVTDEAAQKTFRINIEATEMINEYPMVEKMINVLNLKFYNNKNETK